MAGAASAIVATALVGCGGEVPVEVTPSTSDIPDPVIDVSGASEVARDIMIIPDRGKTFVPNIGIIGGRDSVLIVDTGMGQENAEKVLDYAVKYARGRKLYLTTTHFHPEHAYGADIITKDATYLANKAQIEDLHRKGQPYLTMFRHDFGAAVAKRLDKVQLVDPTITYDRDYDLDLGGRVVQLRATGQAHTMGDQLVIVPDVKMVFTGDLVETHQFAIFPWYPPSDVDVSGVRWREVMRKAIADAPSIVVPGHGNVGDISRLTDTHGYLDELIQETWKQTAEGKSVEDIVPAVKELMFQRHPEWIGREWVEKGIRCVHTEAPKTASR
ncbi:MBL fold metallo-hydrolase [Pseudonocardiaceae bacterium YIM PH 21723]|nr:MBL fold metallo-hydrolase [Pseudonocardiaceae bacterium YIM PH 21723]